MEKRLKLHAILTSILPSGRNVYFQPPESIKIEYPAIIYKVDGVDVKHATNQNYLVRKKYLITLIDRDPDTKLVDKILELPYASLSQSFQRDNLNHYAFSLFY